MYTNLTRGQAFPLAIRVCSKPKAFHTSKPQSSQICFHHNPSLNLNFTKLTSHLVNFPTDSNSRVVENGIVAKPKSFSSGFRLRSHTTQKQNWLLVRGRGFSNWSSQGVNGGSSEARNGKRLPWLAASKAKEVKGLKKAMATKTPISSWGESAKRLEEDVNAGSWGKEAEAKNLAKSIGGDRSRSMSSWEKPAKLLKDKRNLRKPKTDCSSWEVSAEASVGNASPSEKRSTERRMVWVKDRQNDYSVRDRRQEEVDSDGNVEEEEMEVGDDPRWDQIKNKFRRMDDVRSGRSEYRRFDRQENWGRKTWQEASESSVPRLVGQGVYGVGPVLAALSAGRRELYTLYVQEGMDLSSNNKKKKDKKGFEKVLRMAENFGVNIKELRKHDLNMAADNRPHQGLLLDASPLEMVKIKELDPVSVEEDKGSLWVALDEVTDPQNLGAIIRSSYFFGAAGVVLCAKNSAPLSGVVSKASAGSLELMELRYCKNMMQFLTSSAENGWRVLGGSVSSKAMPLNEIVPSEPTILVLGSEGTGLRPLVERSCTQLIRIPGNISVDITVGGNDSEIIEVNHLCSAEEFRSFLAVESLNVSVAAGVLLHHLKGNTEKNEVHVVE